MSQSPSPPGTGPASADAAGVDPAAAVVDAAMALIVERGYAGFTLADVAHRAGIGLDAVHEVVPSKPAILSALMRRIDRTVLASADRGGGDAEAPRDRLFDVLMHRFEALAPYRAALSRIRTDLRTDLAPLLALSRPFDRSMAWMLEAAGLRVGGLGGLLQLKGLQALYLSVVRVWLADDSPDLARTMAALDARLRQAERLAPRLRHCSAGGRK